MVFVETPVFTELVIKLWSDDELGAMQAFLMKNPDAGDVIPGGGGLRKLRWSARSQRKGKQGGTRVIYFRFVEAEQILLLLLYPKSAQEDLTSAQAKSLKALVEEEYYGR